MLFLIAVVLLLTGTLMYYRAIAHLRGSLDAEQPERGARRFFAVEEISLISNPIRMYTLIFHGADEILDDSEVLARVRKRFIFSFVVCMFGSVVAVIGVLLR
ncbi:hypothetical protein [Marinobacter apostichopi]|uniref:hypothetical protein n=1 Tax=Marinobacter apostichopi TaxID=3035454 RepID=UPI002573BFFE|nr:hypothetical protein [Marinobacter sp. LA51]